MRQESPRDILIWDDASQIPADIKAAATQSGVFVNSRQLSDIKYRYAGISTQLFKAKDFQGVQRQQVLI